MPPITLEDLLSLLLQQQQSSQGPVFTSDSFNSINQFPPGTDVNAPYESATPQLFPPPQEMRMEEPGVIYNQGEDLTPEKIAMLKLYGRQ